MKLLCLPSLPQRPVKQATEPLNQSTVIQYPVRGLRDGRNTIDEFTPVFSGKGPYKAFSKEIKPKLVALNQEYKTVLNTPLEGLNDVSDEDLYTPVATYLGLSLEKNEGTLRLQNYIAEEILSGKKFFPQSIKAPFELALSGYERLNPTLNMSSVHFLNHYGLAAECSDVVYFALRYLGTISKVLDEAALTQYYDEVEPLFKKKDTSEKALSRAFDSAHAKAKAYVKKQEDSPAFEKIVDFCFMLDDEQHNAYQRNDRDGVISYDRDLILRKRYKEELIQFYTLNFLNYAVRKHAGMKQNYELQNASKIIDSLIDETVEMEKVDSAFQLVKSSAETIKAQYTNSQDFRTNPFWIELGNLLYSLKTGYKHKTQAEFKIRDGMNFARQKSMGRTELALYAHHFLCGEGKPFPGDTKSPENWLRMKKLAYAWEVPLELDRFYWHTDPKN